MVLDGARDIRSLFKGMWQHLPQIIVAVATVVWITTFMYEPMESVREISLAFVASGFFGWLTKSIAFRKVLRDELISILYSPKHLSAETPRLLYLENTLVAIGLPAQVAKAAAPIFVERLHSPDHPYYYTKLYRKVLLRWIDRDAGTVSVTFENRYTLESLFPAKRILMRSWWKATEKLKGMIPRLESLCVNPKDSKTAMIVRNNEAFVAAPDQGDDPECFEWTCELPPGHAFDVTATFTVSQDLDEDNVLQWEAVVISEGCEFEYDAPEDMVVHFNEVGQVEFQPTNGGSKRLCRSLILPGDGYILSMQRRQEPLPE